MASQVPEEIFSETPEDEEAMEVLRERESPADARPALPILPPSEARLSVGPTVQST